MKPTTVQILGWNSQTEKCFPLPNKTFQDGRPGSVEEIGEKWNICRIPDNWIILEIDPAQEMEGNPFYYSTLFFKEWLMPKMDTLVMDGNLKHYDAYVCGRHSVYVVIAFNKKLKLNKEMRIAWVNRFLPGLLEMTWEGTNKLIIDQAMLGIHMMPRAIYELGYPHFKTGEPAEHIHGIGRGFADDY